MQFYPTSYGLAQRIDAVGGIPTIAAIRNRRRYVCRKLIWLIYGVFFIITQSSDPAFVMADKYLQ
jgi:hypothetical protein